MTAAVLAPSRRSFLAGGASLAALALTGCATQRFQQTETPQFSEYYLAMYGPLPDEKYPVPAIDLTKLDPNMFRTQVADPTGERPGTIVVNTSERHLYLVQEGGQAIRYGVGIGREGFSWNGRANVQYGRKWPTWTPPAEMIKRQPELEKWRGGQPGGLKNPLGARALYLFQNGQDTGYRIHGSPEWWTIGQAMSSGCVRMINQDVIDLFNRVNGKTPVVVV
jgi:lipoprotein-anchoring transpeptidase ErfK/SrfK